MFLLESNFFLVADCPTCAKLYKHGSSYLKQLVGMVKDVSPGFSKIVNKVTELSELKAPKGFLFPDKALESVLSLSDNSKGEKNALTEDLPSEDAVKIKKSNKTYSSPLIRFFNLLDQAKNSDNTTSNSYLGKCPIHAVRSCSIEELSLVLQEKLFQKLYMIFSRHWNSFINMEQDLDENGVN